jgi:hypothetical protein
MRYVTLLITAAMLTACAPRYAVSHVQDYRPKGQNEKLSIQGSIKIDPAHMLTEYAFMARVDNVTRIALNLDRKGNGEISCKAGEETQYCKALPDRSLGASCTGSTENGRVSRVTCFVFVDDERAATFAFN